MKARAYFKIDQPLFNFKGDCVVTTT